jgi:hypothetical protein
MKLLVLMLMGMGASVMRVPEDYCTVDKNHCDQVNSNSGYEFPEILTFREISYHGIIYTKKLLEQQVIKQRRPKIKARIFAFCSFK